MPQCACTFQVNYCLKVHNAHQKLLSPISGYESIAVDTRGSDSIVFLIINTTNAFVASLAEILERQFMGKFLDLVFRSGSWFRIQLEAYTHAREVWSCTGNTWHFQPEVAPQQELRIRLPVDTRKRTMSWYSFPRFCSREELGPSLPLILRKFLTLALHLKFEYVFKLMKIAFGSNINLCSFCRILSQFIAPWLLFS